MLAAPKLIDSVVGSRFLLRQAAHLQEFSLLPIAAFSFVHQSESELGAILTFHLSYLGTYGRRLCGGRESGFCGVISSVYVCHFFQIP